MEKNYKVFGLGDHSVRFMPNVNDISNHILEVAFTSTITEGASIQNAIFSYLLIDGKIDIYRINRNMKDIVYGLLRGTAITNSEGLIISSTAEYFREPITNYIIDSNNNICFNNEVHNREGLEIRTDIVTNDPINILASTSPYVIDFKVCDVELGDHIYKKYYDFRLVEKSPLYKEGDSKESITDFYNGVYDLGLIIDDFKEEVQKYTDKFGNSLAPFLFDEQAKEYYWNKRKQEHAKL
jgi:hypothetical protein